MGKHALAGVIGQRETVAITAVVDEITAKPAEGLGLQLMKPTNHPEWVLYNEKVSGFGGLLAERTMGAPGQQSATSSSTLVPFSPGAYQEHVRFGEKDLVTLRRLGSIGERGATGFTNGAMDWLGRAGLGLKVKLENRLNKLAWDALFNGTYTYKGIVWNFNPPSGNTVQAGTDWSIATSATPLTDLISIVKTNPAFYKYIIKEFIINPVTEAAILSSAEVRAVVVNNASAVGDINKAREILYPGLPPFRVCKDAWQDQSVTGGVITNLAATYFVPNYKVLCIVDMSGTMYGNYGELSLTYNINDPSATLDNPAVGIYSFVDEKGLEEHESPYVKMVTGFNGGANLLRSNDVLIIKGKAGI